MTLLTMNLGGFVKPSENPMFGPSGASLVMFGANYQPLTRDQGQIWRLFIPIFLHAGIIHLALNLFIQWRIGFTLERVWGWWRIIPIYIISGIVGNEYSAVFNRAASVGASGNNDCTAMAYDVGALMGLYGAIVSDNLVNWQVMRNAKNQIIFWLVTLGIIFASGFMPMIDNW